VPILFRKKSMSHVVNVSQTLKSPQWWDNFTTNLYDEWLNESNTVDLLPYTKHWLTYLFERTESYLGVTVHDFDSTMNLGLEFKSEKDYLMTKLKWS
jgi:hypothetical protein